MTHEHVVVRRQVEIVNPLGLHLRPADKFVRLANSFGDTEVLVHFKGNCFNGKSLLELTMLAAELGSLLELEARGPSAQVAIEALADLVASRFGESTEPNKGPDS